MSHRNIPNNPHKGPRQAHMNKVRFNPNRYKEAHERLDRSWYEVMTSLCCRRCCDQIQWKADYGKWEPLERARRCNGCGERNVSIAFHHLCQECAKTTARCAKCQKSPALEKERQRRHLEALKERAGLPESGEPSGPEGLDLDELKNEMSDESPDEDADMKGTEKKDAHILAKYAFVDEPVEDEEFAYLQGLDIRRLIQHKRKVQNLQLQEERSSMRERERRSARRKDKTNPDNEDSLEDSDVEI